MHTLAFFLMSLAFTQVARRLGWSVSKRFLYFAPVPLVVTICFIWGGAIALAIHALIIWLKPHWLVKWIFGYAQGAYASIPNFGLIAESTVPPQAALRHQLISTVPLVIYVACITALEVFHVA